MLVCEIAVTVTRSNLVPRAKEFPAESLGHRRKKRGTPGLEFRKARIPGRKPRGHQNRERRRRGLTRPAQAREKLGEYGRTKLGSKTNKRKKYMARIEISGGRIGRRITHRVACINRKRSWLGELTIFTHNVQTKLVGGNHGRGRSKNLVTEYAAPSIPGTIGSPVLLLRRCRSWYLVDVAADGRTAKERKG